MPRAVGINHIALEVDDLEAALEFWRAIFPELELRGRAPGMAFIDLGDQFLALAQASAHAPDRHRHFGLVVDDKAATLAAAGAAGAAVRGGRFVDPSGNQVEVVQYSEVQFTKAPHVLRGMGLELEKSGRALAELREKGLAPD